MKLTKGSDLSCEQRKEVTSAFRLLQRYHNVDVAYFWILDHAFYIRKDGKLSRKHNHCEPAYLAD